MTRESVVGDQAILEAALVGLESQRNRIDEAIRDIRSRLGVRGSGRLQASPNADQPAPARRTMSAAARRKIAAAQIKRWAAAKAEKTEAKPVTKPKRKLSAAGRAAIIAATKKRWAAVHKAQKAA